MNTKQQRAKVNISAIARDYGQKALEKLVALIDDPDPNVAVKAANSVLDRGYGKATQVLAGDGENPLMVAAVGIDRPPAETREQWLARRAKEITVHVGTSTRTTN